MCHFLFITVRKKIKANHKRIINGIYRRLFNAFGPQYWWPGETPFEIAVGAILTQNTNWGNVEKAVTNLKKHNALSARTLYKMNPRALASLIKPAGYYNVKTRRLKAFAGFLKHHYRNSMKRMKAEDTQFIRDRLLQVHGIGPETADSILLYALEKPVFVVDAYTKRVLSRHGLADEKAAYQAIQELFQKNLPKKTKLFNEYHALFVRLAKVHCRTRPKCRGCPLEGI